MLILPVIETESKMFENPFHLHFLTRVLFLKYRKYCDPYHMCICEKDSRSQGFRAPARPPVAERGRGAEGMKEMIISY